MIVSECPVSQEICQWPSLFSGSNAESGLLQILWRRTWMLKVDGWEIGLDDLPVGRGRIGSVRSGEVRFNERHEPLVCTAYIVITALCTLAECSAFASRAQSAG